jgi:hypothetical protein
LNPQEEELEEEDSCDEDDEEVERSADEQDMDDQEEGRDDSGDDLNERQHQFLQSMMSDGEFIKQSKNILKR